MIRKVLVYLITTLICFSSCQKKGNRPEALDLVVLYTSQSYGDFFNWSIFGDTLKSASLSNFKSLINEQRELFGDNCIILDNGNFLTDGGGNFYYNYIDTVSEPLAYRVQRYIGYDAVALGRSDMKVIEPYQSVRHDTVNTPPTLCANLISKETGRPHFPPYAYIERQGVRIVVFSLVDSNKDAWRGYQFYRDLYKQDMKECTRDLILKIKHEYHPDLVIALISSSDDHGIQEDIPGIDLVLTTFGDDRKLHAGQVRIHMFRDAITDTYSKQLFATEIKLDQYERDAEYDKEFQEESDKLRQFFKSNYGFLPFSINGSYGSFSSHDYYRDIIHQAQLWFTDADVSITNIVTPTCHLDSGAVNLNRINQLYNEKNNMLVKCRMTGAEIKQFLEYGYAQQYNTMHGPGDRLLRRKYDAKGHELWHVSGRPYLHRPPTHYASASGIKYEVDLRQDPGNRVHILGMLDKSQGLEKMWHMPLQPFVADSSYVVVLNSYLARDNGEYFSKGLNWNEDKVASRILPSHLVSSQYVLYKYFHDYASAYTVMEGNTCDIVPEEWWRTAKTRETITLNPIW